MVMSVKQANMVGRRPILSAKPPSASDPIPMPTNSMERTTPSATLSIPHSLVIPGEAKLIANKSKPSKALRATVMLTTKICKRVIADWFNKSLGSEMFGLIAFIRKKFVVLYFYPKLPDEQMAIVVVIYKLNEELPNRVANVGTFFCR